MSRIELKNRDVLVVGLARSGLAAAELLLRRGAAVTVTDLRSRAELGECVTRIQRAGARLALGRHSESVFLKHDLIIVSPGVPRDLEPLVAAEKAGIEIIGELELAARLLEVPIIAVTGTNGKSTTTTFIGHFLRGVGRRVFVGGNLGTPLSTAVDGDHDIVVAEVSSFQLEWAPTFHPHVAALLNVSEDHLDRYEGFEDYAATKARIFAHQGSSDFVVVSQEDPIARELAHKSTGTLYTFGHSSEVTRGIRHLENELRVNVDGRWASISIEGFRPRGRHNIENLMAAFLAAKLAGTPIGELAKLIPYLEGLPHRLELVRELDGVRYYNDSKATNVASVLCSLRDFEEPVVLLMGGRDKGGEYTPLEPIVRDKTRVVIAFGEARALIKRGLGHLGRVVEVLNLEQALDCARAEAREGDSVVLSPACSSYDQFPNYEVRGDTFRRLVWGFEEARKVSA